MRSRFFRTLCLAGVTGAIPMLGACEENTVSSDQPTAPSVRNDAAPLADVLGARYEQYQRQADDETKRIYTAGIEAVAASGVLERAVNTGDPAPAFTLPDADGNDVALSSLLEKGPVVLVWYRGGWCPYCNLTLRAFTEIVPQIRDAGAGLVAISPELPDNTAQTVEENGLDFVVLSDVGNEVAKTYGAVFRLTPEVHRKYNDAFGFDAHNGQDSGELPLAATYVIDRDGVVRFAFLDADYTKRAEPSDVLAALEQLR